jgi:hypothetical protein
MKIKRWRRGFFVDTAQPEIAGGKGSKNLPVPVGRRPGRQGTAGAVRYLLESNFLTVVIFAVQPCCNPCK